MKIVELNSKDFTEFVNNNKYSNYFQLPQYGHLMSKFKFNELYLGFKNNNELLGVCLILYRPIFMSFREGYIPRGLIIDYENTQLVKAIMLELEAYLLKNRFMYLKLDPPIIISKKDKKGRIIESFKSSNDIINIFTQLGCTHKKSDNSFDTIKPSWEAETSLNMPIAKLYSNLSKSVRNKINKNKKYGLEIFKEEIINVNAFYDMVKSDDNHSINYYKELFYNFSNEIELYYSKLNTEYYVKSSQKTYKEESDYNNYLSKIIESGGFKGKLVKNALNKKIQSDKDLLLYKNNLVQATNLLNKYPTGVVIGCSLILKYNHKIYLIKESYNKDYRFLTPTYSLKWKIIEEYAESDYNTFNLNAIANVNIPVPKEYQGLNEMKFGYNAYALEYIGEFDFIINKLINNLYKKIKTTKKD